MNLPDWAKEIFAIFALLAVIAVVLARLPKGEIVHSPAFRRRRFLNWFPVGLTYAFLYMGRYNLNALQPTILDKKEFSTIYFWGTLTYGISFVINGPLTDRFGGKKTIILAAVGALIMNVMMGVAVTTLPHSQLVFSMSVLYAANMYFQSFGAVSIVKVNSAWFHLRERGTFGGIFGILISLGIYFAFDWSRFIIKHLTPSAVFFIPAGILVVFAVLDQILVKDSPFEAGHGELEVGDASSADDGTVLPLTTIAKRMLTNPVILVIAAVEFCSGYLRNAIMQYYPPFARQTGLGSSLVASHWGMFLCIAGIFGGMFAGSISDHVFQSRRGPVSAVLYGVMIAGALAMFGVLGNAAIGWVVLFMSLAIIGVHGMLSGTASMDFGGRKNAGLAVGIIDGFVYLGTAAEALILGHVLPEGPKAADPSGWWTWPMAIVPVAVLGFVLALRLWNAKPVTRAAAH